MDKLLIVDGSNLLFQMFYGMPARIVNAQGRAIQDRFFGTVFSGLSREDLRLWQSMVDRVCDNISSLEG